MTDTPISTDQSSDTPVPVTYRFVDSDLTDTRILHTDDPVVAAKNAPQDAFGFYYGGNAEGIRSVREEGVNTEGSNGMHYIDGKPYGKSNIEDLPSGVDPHGYLRADIIQYGFAYVQLRNSTRTAWLHSHDQVVSTA